MVLEAFLRLTSTEREAVDNFAFAQSLLRKGGDAQRRFALISLDIALDGGVTFKGMPLKRARNGTYTYITDQDGPSSSRRSY